MLKKVLIAEDQEMINSSIKRTLEDFGVHKADHVYYCDDAYSRISKAIQQGEPYDLLITDLMFEEDYRSNKLKDGRSLIQAVRQIQPHIQVMVFSGESRMAIIDELIVKQRINAYVMKARRDGQQLREALQALQQNRNCFPRDRSSAVAIQNAFNFTENDIVLVELLAQGHLQKEIPAILTSKAIKPAGLSSIEKRISKMKDALGFATTEQLIAYCKDVGII